MSERPIAVVTGAAAGVGRAVAGAFARQGYDVAILARGRAGLASAAEEVSGEGARSLGISLDVADLRAVRRAANRVAAELGPIEVWVNDASAGTLGFAWDTSMDDFRRVMDVAFYGQVHGTLVALEHMRPRGEGVIVNVGSAQAYRSIPLQAPYCAAAHAVKGFSESVITELSRERSRVRLCMVELPGLGASPFDGNPGEPLEHPRQLAPGLPPEVVARAIVFLAEHPRRDLWVGLSTAGTILGERLAPKLLDLYLGWSRAALPQANGGRLRAGPRSFEPSGLEGAPSSQDIGAHESDPMLWMSMHRRSITSTLGVLSVLGGIGGLVAARR